MSSKSSSNEVGEVRRVMLSLSEKMLRSSSLSTFLMFSVSRSWERSMSMSPSGRDELFILAVISIQPGAGKWGSQEVMVRWKKVEASCSNAM